MLFTYTAKYNTHLRKAGNKYLTCKCRYTSLSRDLFILQIQVTLLIPYGSLPHIVSAVWLLLPHHHVTCLVTL